MIFLARLSTMEISNEKLASLNNISEMNFHAMCVEFRQHTQTLAAMKRQLESCFRRIRSLKSKLALQYPEAYRGMVRCTLIHILITSLGDKHSLVVLFWGVHCRPLVVGVSLIVSLLCVSQLQFHSVSWNRKTMMRDKFG